MANVPLFYKPRWYQELAWNRRLKGDITYYLKCWHRQAGKDSDDIEYANTNAYMNPGTQTAYVGQDNKWVKANIFEKYIEGRSFFSEFPKDVVDVNSTNQKVTFLNATSNKDNSIVRYIGYKEQGSLIGSSYDKWMISELSLYKRGQFDFIWPVFDNKIANHEPLEVGANFTPRGLSNEAADWLRALTGEDEPEKWPGFHEGPMGNVYFDYIPGDKSGVYTEGQLDAMRQRDILKNGNDNLFRQEILCEFMSVNAGLVFPAIEIVRKDGRYCPYNLDTSKPVYMAWDISSKDKLTDWTSAVIFQLINGRMIIYDWYENNRMSVVECVQELSQRPYFHLIRAACLPWDSDRSGSSMSPLDECRKTFPNITWHKLERAYKQDSINNARSLFPNLVLNSDKCEWLVECFESWEYKEMTSIEDFASAPKHDRYSHLMDAFCYAANFIKQVPYLQSNSGRPAPIASHYGSFDLDENLDPVIDEWQDWPPGMRPSTFSSLRNKRPGDIYKKSEGGVYY